MSAVFPRGPLEPDPDEIRVVTGRDAEREQLAAALRPHETHSAILDALLPVVDRIANERAAAALEAAAAELIRLSVGSGYNGWYASWLRDRAATLRADHLDPS